MMRLFPVTANHASYSKLQQLKRVVTRMDKGELRSYSKTHQLSHVCACACVHDQFTCNCCNSVTNRMEYSFSSYSNSKRPVTVRNQV